MPEISVVIPTYHRPDLLAETLEAFSRQTFSDFEVLVIDNASCPKARLEVENFARSARFLVRYVPNPHGGNSGSRNLGASLARSPLLAYTDDDVSVSPNWLEAYHQAFATHPSMAAAGGRVSPLWEEQPPRWLLDYMGDGPFFGVFALMDLSPEFFLGPKVMFFSCNMAIRRDVFTWTGFHPEMFGARTLGDGESGLGDDLAAAGALTGHLPEAEVFHRIGRTRMTKNYIRRWAWHLGGCNMYRRWRGRRRTLSAILREVPGIVREHAGDWATSLLTPRDHSREAIDASFRASEGICKLAYLYWMLTDPRTREVLDATQFAPCPGSPDAQGDSDKDDERGT